jgi:flagellar hook-basal body protein
MLGSTISGLMAANKGIDVTSNNISNGATVGFKQSTVSYADIFPNDPSASPKTAIGAGVAVSSVNKNMSQGSISSSGKVTDIAITGNGFFVLGTSTNSSSSVNTSSGYTTFDSPVFVDQNLTVNGSGTLNGASVVIQNPDPNDQLLFSDMNGILSVSYNSTTGILKLTGSATVAQYQAALRTVQFQTSNSAAKGTRTIDFNLGTAIKGPNGHYYEMGSNDADWPDAKTKAENSSYLGLKGYLATITSQAENDFIYQKLQADSWVGGSDNFQMINTALGTTKFNNQSESDGHWYWVTGPEAGTNFYNNGTTATYSNWASGEPNNALGDEDVIELYSSGGGKWNDLLHVNPLHNVTTSVIEYNGTPNMSVSTKSNITVGGNTSSPKASPSSDVFTRAGDFQLDKEGYLVNSTGLKLQGYDLKSTDLSKTSIRIAFDNGTPDGKLQNISINSIGIISVNYAGQTTPSELFQIAIATFPKDSSLKAIGNTNFMPSGESGNASYGKPSDPGYGSILSGSLEESNVDITNELVRLIKYQQIYNGNARVLQTMTEVASRVTDKL